MIPIPRTPEQISARIRAAGGVFGSERQRLLSALPYDEALRLDLLTEEGKKPEARATWEQGRLLTQQDVRAAILDYLPFAWGKANDCRGLSACRSLEHFRGLLWLYGPEGELIANRPEFGDRYEFYGKPALVLVSEFVGFNWQAADDDRWRNGEHERGMCATEALGR